MGFTRCRSRGIRQVEMPVVKWDANNMPKFQAKKLEANIIAKTGDILEVCKSQGKEAAFDLYRDFDAFIAGKRDALSPSVLDLVLQLEFFMEEHPETEWNDVVNAYYAAKASLLQK
jgi:hypothetical protein